MTREQFLSDLREALHGMKEDEIEGVISYYGELIDDSVEAGMTEEAAVNAMEPASVIASRVLSEAGVEGEKQPEAEEGVKVIRRSAENITCLRVNASNQRVFIKSGEDGDITLRYRIDPSDIYRLHEDAGELTLEHKRRPVTSFTREASYTAENILDRVSKFLSSLDLTVLVNEQPARAIEITLPRVFRGKVIVSTGNARIGMENVTCVEEANLVTSNARIMLSHIVARRVIASTNNGRVELHDVYAKSGVEANTSNGRIVAEKTSAGGELRFDTSNGRIEAEGLEAPSVSLHTSNGTISAALKGAAADYGFDSAVVTGKSTLTGESADTGKRLKAATSNGSVTLRFDA